MFLLNVFAECLIQGRIQDFWKGGSYVKVWGVRFANFISSFLNILRKLNNLVSLRPNYFNFIGYLKTWGREGGLSEPPLDPPLL